MDRNNVVTAINLVEDHLKGWAEPDPHARLTLLQKIYSRDIKVIDPGTILKGCAEVSDFIGDLLSKNPGFNFRIARPIEVHHNTAILLWEFGPATQPDKISGQDIFTLKDGRITSFIIFVEGVTAIANDLK